ncbi:hypothetical protein SLA2020_270360 [Shorea laevis]
MRRSNDYTSKPQQQHGLDSSSYDYHSHIHRLMERLPTIPLKFPSTQTFIRPSTTGYLTKKSTVADLYYKHGHRKHKTAPVRFQEKVEVIEYERADGQFEAGGKNVGNCEVYEEASTWKLMAFSSRSIRALSFASGKASKPIRLGN